MDGPAAAGNKGGAPNVPSKGSLPLGRGGAKATTVASGLPGQPADVSNTSASLIALNFSRTSMSGKEAEKIIRNNWPAQARNLAAQSRKAGNTEAAKAFDASANAAERGDIQEAAKQRESGMMALSAAIAKTKDASAEAQKNQVAAIKDMAEIYKKAAESEAIFGILKAGIQIAMLL